MDEWHAMCGTGTLGCACCLVDMLILESLVSGSCTGMRNPSASQRIARLNSCLPVIEQHSLVYTRPCVTACLRVCPDRRRASAMFHDMFVH